ncbi:MAG: ABC transporter ATP-binding protein [Beijerinckiaceae bacterium]|jgi:peptide/nickel transport system ATP-binding protein|nr:ABC transporter ATP-binding protein [Beijerinckiaceae bacterium]
MSALVDIRNVSKRFAPRLSLGEKIAARLGQPIETRTVHAVDSVSFEIRKGEVLGLVGESGCGKSTLGRVIAGIHAPSDGVVTLDGAPILGPDGRKRTSRVQMVFQDPFASLDPRIRIGETISEGPIAHGLVSKADAKAYAAQWLAAVGLPADAADRFPHQFSGGQRQRVAIARALAMKPDMLVCDEPVASLDVSIQAQIVNLFLKLRREFGLTMLFISHDLGIVRHISDRIAIMYLGRIVELGPTEAVYKAPSHPYTRALLDSIPKLVTEAEELVSFKPILGELPSPLSPPPGCHFHLRCPRAEAKCREIVPARRETSAGRDVACHFPLEE